MRRRAVLAAAAGITAVTPLGRLGRPALAQIAARTLRFVPTVALTSIDPLWSLATISYTHGYMVWDTLFSLGHNLARPPQAAERAEVSSDELTWTMLAAQSRANTGPPHGSADPARRRIRQRLPTSSTVWPSTIWGCTCNLESRRRAGRAPQPSMAPRDVCHAIARRSTRSFSDAARVGPRARSQPRHRPRSARRDERLGSSWRFSPDCAGPSACLIGPAAAPQSPRSERRCV